MQAFLVRWWSEQTPAVKQLFKDHVDRGHMEFVNGGWAARTLDKAAVARERTGLCRQHVAEAHALCRYVQHDEAASHYGAMVDQTTLGHMCAPAQPAKTLCAGQLARAQSCCTWAQRMQMAVCRWLNATFGKIPTVGLADRPLRPFSHACLPHARPHGL